MDALDKLTVDLAVRQAQHYYSTHQWTRLAQMWHSDTSRTSIRNVAFCGTINEWIEHSQATARPKRPARDVSPPTSTAVDVSGTQCASHETVEILIASDRAVVTSLVTLRSRFQYRRCVFELETRAHLVQRLERIISTPAESPHKSATWKLVALDTIYINDTMTLPFPQANSPIFEARAAQDIAVAQAEVGARESYHLLAWKLRSQGVRVRSDLPGFDNDATWQPVVQSALAWLGPGI